MNHEHFTEMSKHNKTQTDNQKARRTLLGGSAKIIEGIFIQNDPSDTTMCKLIQMVTGCDTFSTLSGFTSLFPGHGSVGR